MNKEIRNLLLGDNLAELHKHCPAAKLDQHRRIGVLARRYIELTSARNRLQEGSRRLSRQIGNAHTGGKNASALITAMRGYSTERAALDRQLTALETQLDTLLEGHDAAGQSGNATQGGAARHPDQPGDTGPVSIALLQDESADWNRYLEDHPAASLYHRAEWRNLISDTFSHQAYYCVARNHYGNIVGILPLIRLTSRLFGDFMVSLPYFNYGGALGDNADIERALMRHAGELGAGLGVSHIEFRDDIPRSGMPVRTGKVNMVLPLPSDTDVLWEGFSSKLRSQIRRAGRAGPQVLRGGIELLDDFYRVFSRNMRDLGTPVYGKGFFRNILDTFPDECTLIIARLDGKSVGAGFLARSGKRMEIPWASTLREVNHLSINMSLYWETLRYACERGCSEFDFGRSTVDSGTFRFKQQWGAMPRPLYWHYWLDSDRELPALNPSNPRYALFIALWKHLPLPLTRWLGPLVVKNLP